MDEGGDEEEDEDGDEDESCETHFFMEDDEIKVKVGTQEALSCGSTLLLTLFTADAIFVVPFVISCFLIWSTVHNRVP